MTAPTIPAGMVPYGPDHPDYPNAPRDWDFGPVLGDDGEKYEPYEDGGLDWKHGLSARGIGADIIAYTRATPEAGTPGQGEAGFYAKDGRYLGKLADWPADCCRVVGAVIEAGRIVGWNDQPAIAASAPDQPGREAIALSALAIAFEQEGLRSSAAGVRAGAAENNPWARACMRAILALIPAQPADQREGALRESAQALLDWHDGDDSGGYLESRISTLRAALATAPSTESKTGKGA